jgi:hypothetical protein
MIRKLVSLVALTAALAAPLVAAAEGLTATAKAGTLGLGLELSGGPGRYLIARGGVNYFDYDFSHDYENIDYDLEFELRSVAALLDWHPAGGSFRMTSGMLFNRNELAADAKPEDFYDIDGTMYPAELVGDLSANVGFDDYAPYVGLGWATNNGIDGGFGLSVDLGVAYQGSPEVQLTASGPLAADPGFQADLDAERRALADDLDEYEYYPVVALGFNYRF